MEASLCLHGFPMFDLLHIDELLDFSNEELFDSLDIDSPPTSTTSPESAGDSDGSFSGSRDTMDELCIPKDDMMELEWVSNFVTESFSFAGKGSSGCGTPSFLPMTAVPRRARSKRSRACDDWTSRIVRLTSASFSVARWPDSGRRRKAGRKSDRISESGRKCTHCASEKTPQWRAGPMGPKTLCNACGVRYNSGRLLPEYRPAASPTFVSSQHSNSHQKVVQLRRQKAGIPHQAPALTKRD